MEPQSPACTGDRNARPITREGPAQLVATRGAMTQLWGSPASARRVGHDVKPKRVLSGPAPWAGALEQPIQAPKVRSR
jgi:hypothetical protein